LRTGSDVAYGPVLEQYVFLEVPVMRCALCDRPEVTFGDGHLCVADGGSALRSARPAPNSAWRVTSWVLLAVTAAYLLAATAKMVLLVQDYQFVDRLTADPDAINLDELNRLAGRERAVGALVQVLVLCYLVGFAIWFAMIWKVMVRNGINPRGLLRHWTVIAWAVATVASFAIALFSRDPAIDAQDLVAARAQLLAFDRDQIIFTAVRLLAGSLLIAVVWELRKRVRTSIFGPLEAMIQQRTQVTSASR
jgi:hypothetical protein